MHQQTPSRSDGMKKGDGDVLRRSWDVKGRFRLQEEGLKLAGSSRRARAEVLETGDALFRVQIELGLHELTAALSSLSRRLNTLEAAAAPPKEEKQDDAAKELARSARCVSQALPGIASSRARRRALRGYFREMDEQRGVSGHKIDPATRALVVEGLACLAGRLRTVGDRKAASGELDETIGRDLSQYHQETTRLPPEEGDMTSSDYYMPACFQGDHSQAPRSSLREARVLPSTGRLEMEHFGVSEYPVSYPASPVTTEVNDFSNRPDSPPQKRQGGHVASQAQTRARGCQEATNIVLSRTKITSHNNSGQESSQTAFTDACSAGVSVAAGDSDSSAATRLKVKPTRTAKTGSLLSSTGATDGASVHFPEEITIGDRERKVSNQLTNYFTKDEELQATFILNSAGITTEEDAQGKGARCQEEEEEERKSVVATAAENALFDMRGIGRENRFLVDVEAVRSLNSPVGRTFPSASSYSASTSSPPPARSRREDAEQALCCVSRTPRTQQSSGSPVADGSEKVAGGAGGFSMARIDMAEAALNAYHQEVGGRDERWGFREGVGHKRIFMTLEGKAQAGQKETGAMDNVRRGSSEAGLPGDERTSLVDSSRLEADSQGFFDLGALCPASPTNLTKRNDAEDARARFNELELRRNELLKNEERQHVEMASTAAWNEADPLKARLGLDSYLRGTPAYGTWGFRSPSESLIQQPTVWTSAMAPSALHPARSSSGSAMPTEGSDRDGNISSATPKPDDHSGTVPLLSRLLPPPFNEQLRGEFVVSLTSHLAAYGTGEDADHDNAGDMSIGISSAPFSKRSGNPGGTSSGSGGGPPAAVSETLINREMLRSDAGGSLSAGPIGAAAGCRWASGEEGGSHRHTADLHVSRAFAAGVEESKYIGPDRGPGQDSRQEAAEGRGGPGVAFIGEQDGSVGGCSELGYAAYKIAESIGNTEEVSSLQSANDCGKFGSGEVGGAAQNSGARASSSGQSGGAAALSWAQDYHDYLCSREG